MGRVVIKIDKSKKDARIEKFVSGNPPESKSFFEEGDTLILENVYQIIIGAGVNFYEPDGSWKINIMQENMVNTIVYVHGSITEDDLYIKNLMAVPLSIEDVRCACNTYIRGDVCNVGYSKDLYIDGCLLRPSPDDKPQNLSEGKFKTISKNFLALMNGTSPAVDMRLLGNFKELTLGDCSEDFAKVKLNNATVKHLRNRGYSIIVGDVETAFCIDK